jgi:hypothetical protein
LHRSEQNGRQRDESVHSTSARQVGQATLRRAVMRRVASTAPAGAGYRMSSPSGPAFAARRGEPDQFVSHLDTYQAAQLGTRSNGFLFATGLLTKAI